MKNRDAYVLTRRDPNKEIDINTYIKAHKLIIQLDTQLREALDLELRIVNLNEYAIEKCQKMIREDGVSSVMSSMRIQEEVMPKVADSRRRFLIVDMLRSKLLNLAPQQELIIVDNYIFPPRGFGDNNSKIEYIGVFEDIFQPIVRQIKSLIFVTKRNFNHALYSECKTLLLNLNPNLSVVCNVTEDFHDRFWIVDRRDGLFVGTSLNGIGRKYALVDTIRKEDTEEIVKTLEALRLI